MKHHKKLYGRFPVYVAPRPFQRESSALAAGVLALVLTVTICGVAWLIAQI